MKLLAKWSPYFHSFVSPGERVMTPEEVEVSHSQLLKQIYTVKADPELVDSMTFFVGDTLSFDVYRKNAFQETVELTVCQDRFGQRYFDSGKGRLYFKVRGNVFFVYSMTGHDPYLKQMYIALSCLPLHARREKAWSDYLPVSIARPQWLSRKSLFKNRFKQEDTTIKSTIRWINDYTTQGAITSPLMKEPVRTQVNFQPEVGLFIFHVGNWKWLRK